MNLDDDARVLDPNEHREIWNSIIAVSESDHVSCLQNIKGTTNVFALPINSGTTYTFDLVNSGRFSGDNASFDIITSVGTYGFHADAYPGMTNQTVFDSLVCLTAPIGVPVPVVFKTAYFDIVMVSGKMTIIAYENITITTYFDSSAMTVTKHTPFDLTGVRAIGSCEDVQENAIIFFLCDTVYGVNHSIIRIYLSDYHFEWILKSEPLLNFKYDHLINSANRIGDLLYWTDGYFNSYLNNDFNPPRKINVKKAKAYTASLPNKWLFTKCERVFVTINNVSVPYTGFVGLELLPYEANDNVVSWVMDGVNHDNKLTGYGTIYRIESAPTGYRVTTSRLWTDTESTRIETGYILPYVKDQYFGIDWQTLDVIKWKPSIPPSSEYGYNSAVSENMIRGKQFQFGYSHIYDDNEKSVISPISNISNPPELANYHASFNVFNTDQNYITVGFDSGSMCVERIIIYVREGNTGQWKELKQIYKFNNDGECIINSDIEITYDFYGSEILAGVDQADINRLFDFVPPIVKKQELFEKNRLIYADYIEGFDNVDIDIELTTSAEEVGVLGSVFSEFIKYTDGYPHYDLIQTSALIKGTSETRYFFAGVVELDGFWQPGFDYNIDISCYPQTYTPINFGYVNYPQTYPNQFYKKQINSSISINSPVGGTIEQFLNDVVYALRNTYYNSLVIALNNYDYKSMDSSIYGDFLCAYSANHPPYGPICTSTQLAFIFENGEFEGAGVNPLPSSSYSGYVRVSVEKIETRVVYPTWKSGETKLFGITYWDESGRCGFVNTSDESSIYINSQIDPPVLPIYNGGIHTIFKNRIFWNVNHKPPLWARYWNWMFSDVNPFNLFAIISDIRILDVSLDYIFINVNQFIEDTAKTSKKFVVSTYKWQKGDRVRFVFNKTDDGEWKSIPGGLDFEILCENIPGDPYSANAYKMDADGEPIVDPDGNKIPDTGKAGILVNGFAFNLYGIERYKTVVEIYRPTSVSDNPVYYEYGERMDILDPHTSICRHGGITTDQVYSLTSGANDTPSSGEFTLGDTWITSRALSCGFPTLSYVSFPVERRNFSDYNESSSINIGFPNVKNINSKQQWLISNLRYGGTYLENTQINELSKFLGEDYIALPEKFGPINYMKEIGFTLKVIQKYKPSSIYVGRQGLTQADIKRGEVLYASSNTLGTVTTSESNYGTEHPESCIKHEGNLYYYDINSGVIVRDSGNGIRAISQQEDGDAKTPYKIKSLTQTKSRIFQSHDVNVFSTYDGRYDIVYFCFVDHTDPSESYTIGFHEPSNKWVSFYSFIPDFIASMKQSTFSWKLGSMWLHDTGTRMNFYGVQYKQTVKTVSNKEPLLKKRFLSLTENSNKIWHLGNQGDVYVPPDQTYKRGQTSLVKYGAFQDLEGTIYAALGKNMTTHSISPTNDDFINGDDLRGNYIELTLNNDSTDEVNLFALTVDSIISNP